MALRVIREFDRKKTCIVRAISNNAANPAVGLAGSRPSLSSKVGPSYQYQHRLLLRCECNRHSISTYQNLATAKVDNTIEGAATTSVHPESNDAEAYSYATSSGESPSSSSSSSQIIDVSTLADEMRQQVRNYTGSWKGRQLKLVGIISQQDEHDHCHDADREDEEEENEQVFYDHVDDNNCGRHDTKTYSEKIAEACIEDGIEFELISYDQPYEVEHIIQKGNQRDDVDGILVFYPIYEVATHQEQQPSTMSDDLDLDDYPIVPPLPRGPYKNKSTGVYYKTFDDYLRDMVDVSKDVEGLSGDYYDRCSLSVSPIQQLQKGAAAAATTSPGNTMSSPLSSNEIIFPCTALSIKHILDHYHPLIHTEQGDKSDPSQSILDSSWNGQTVSVVNRSDILGRPLAAMLASSGANVYSIDVDSILQFQQSGTKRVSRSEESKSAAPNSAAVADPTASTASNTQTEAANTNTTGRDLEWCLRKSSVVVTAVPDPHFQLPCHVIAPGSTVVNVSEYENVNEEEISRQSGVNYIPKIGQVTVAVLEQNLVRLHSRRQREKGMSTCSQ